MSTYVKCDYITEKKTYRTLQTIWSGCALYLSPFPPGTSKPAVPRILERNQNAFPDRKCRSAGHKTHPVNLSTHNSWLHSGGNRRARDRNVAAQGVDSNAHVLLLTMNDEWSRRSTAPILCRNSHGPPGRHCDETSEERPAVLPAIALLLEVASVHRHEWALRDCAHDHHALLPSYDSSKVCQHASADRWRSHAEADASCRHSTHTPHIHIGIQIGDPPWPPTSHMSGPGPTAVHGGARARSRKPKAVSAAAAAFAHARARRLAAVASYGVRPMRACAAAVGSVLKPMPRGAMSAARVPFPWRIPTRLGWVWVAFFVPRWPRRSPNIRQRGGGPEGVRAVVWDSGTVASGDRMSHGIFRLASCFREPPSRRGTSVWPLKSKQHKSDQRVWKRHWGEVVTDSTPLCGLSACSVPLSKPTARVKDGWLAETTVASTSSLSIRRSLCPPGHSSSFH